MQLYPHWLDGEFVRIASNAAGPRQTVREMIRALKLHALLGTQFVLNDVQIFDSAAVLALFADCDLLEFLLRDRSFLDLRVDPDPALGDSPFSLAARGLTRTCTPGWISSVFMGDPTPIKKLADEIIKDVQDKDYFDLKGPSLTVQQYPEHATLLKAARQAVHYFGSHDNPQKLVAATGERTNYYQVLSNLFDKLGESAEKIGQLPEAVPDRPILLQQVQEDLLHVEETLNFINKEIEDPDKRKARSCVLAILNHERDRPKREHIWNNVVQAWNYATEQTLRPEGGSVGTLPGAVSPAPYLETPTEILVPVKLNERERPVPGIANLPILPIDIDEIEWKRIAEVRANTVDTIEQLAHARYIGGDAVHQPLRNHLDAVGRILHPPKKGSNIPSYVFKIVAATGATAIAMFGDPAVSDYIKPTAKAADLWGAIAADIWRDTAPWRQRRALTNTLFRAAMGQPK